ncbi:MAG TPA: hypothetical protein VIX85_02120, partial [Acidimicrobiales bacterium]
MGSADRKRSVATAQSGGPAGPSGSTGARRPPEVEPFLVGCAFPAAPGVPYPRAHPADAGRLPADTWATASIPVGVRLELTGNAEAVEIAYETGTTELGYRGEGAGTTFTSWRGQSVLDDVPAGLGRGLVTLNLVPGSDGSGGAGDSPDRWVITLPEGMRPSILAVRGVG